jgi:hypothetical protein
MEAVSRAAAKVDVTTMFAFARATPSFERGTEIDHSTSRMLAVNWLLPQHS